MGVFTVLREFAGGTSIHGFGFLVQNKSSTLTKIIWTLSLIVAISYASYEMRKSVIGKKPLFFPNKQSLVIFWLNWIEYGAVSYSLSCTEIYWRFVRYIRALVFIYFWLFDDIFRPFGNLKCTFQTPKRENFNTSQCQMFFCA